MTNITHTQAALMTGRTRKTIQNWKKHYPELYRIVMAGCKSVKEASKCDSTPK